MPRSLPQGTIAALHVWALHVWALHVWALHVWALFTLAFAARLYDLLARYPVFFVARRSRLPDVILLVLVLSVLLPGLVVLLVWLAGLRRRRWRQVLLAAFVLLSTSAIASAALKPIHALPGPAVVALAVALGGAATGVYFRFAAARTLVTILSPVVLLSPGLFLFRAPVSGLLWGEPDRPAMEVKVGSPAPVVMIVFDEFCGTSLMDEHRRIDPVRYPSFASLAEEATWFRNATTTSPSTHHALLSLLAGVYPEGTLRPPIGCEHPQNLFTLLAGSHELTACEAVTYLCPDRLNRYGRSRGGLWPRLRSLLIDAAVLQLHVLLPQDWPFALPEVTGRWGNFLGQDRHFGGRPDPYVRRRGLFQQFIRGIESSEKPGLYFAHVMLPHAPWGYLPSGKQYALPLPPRKANLPSVAHQTIGLRRGSEVWTDDRTAVVQARQRYLLQVGMVDRLLGELLAHLRRTGLYDRSLIVITSDHGVSFRPGRQRRGIDKTNYPDVMSVPLFVKLPQQRRGTISDRNVQTIDLLPTIAAALAVEPPWEFEGTSLLDGSRPPPVRKEIAPDEESSDRWVFDGRFDEKYRTLDRMLALFGSGAKPGGLFAIGPHAGLLGRPVETLKVDRTPRCRIELTGPRRYVGLDLDGKLLPCYIGGCIQPGPGLPLPLDLAIAVNGAIRAVTRSFRVDGLEDCWAAMVPEEAFLPGGNRLEVFVVHADGSELTLQVTTPVAPGTGR